MEIPRFAEELDLVRIAGAAILGLTGYVALNTARTARVLYEYHNKQKTESTTALLNGNGIQTYPFDVIVVYARGAERVGNVFVPDAIGERRAKAGYKALRDLKLAPEMILLGGPDPIKHLPASSLLAFDLLHTEASQRGEKIPEGMIRVGLKSTNTFENAREERAFLEKRGFHNALVISSLEHFDRIVVAEDAVGLTAPRFRITHLAAEDIIPPSVEPVSFFKKDVHELLGIAALTLDRANRIETVQNIIRERLHRAV